MDEYELWVQYIAKRGTLNVGLRTEAMIAQLIQKICVGMGITKAGRAPFTVADFYIHGGSSADIPETDDGEVDGDEEEEGIKFGDAVRAFRIIGTTKG